MLRIKDNKVEKGYKVLWVSKEYKYIDNFDIKLLGVDIISTNYDCEEQHWGTLLDMNEIEYLKIEPMLEKDK